MASEGEFDVPAERSIDFAEVRRRLYSPDALEQYRELGYLDDPTTKEFPKFQTRFAPTANGPLHLGSALCLLMNYIWARISGTKILLRYEQHEMCDWTIPLRGTGEFDRAREAVARDIEWLGMEGQVEEVEPLVIRGEREPERIYDWLTGYQAQPGLDVISQEIARLDDDRRLGVNMLVRGWDLYGASYLYFALARRLGSRQGGSAPPHPSVSTTDGICSHKAMTSASRRIVKPPDRADTYQGRAPFFTFVPVLCDPTGQKICKSTGAESVRKLGLSLGLSREELVGRLYSILVPGDVHERMAPDEAVQAFVFSWRKQRRLTAEVMRGLGLRPAPPAWKPIRPPSFHKDYDGATSVIWDPDFVKRAGRDGQGSV